MTRRELDPWVESYLSYLGDMRRLAPRTIADVRCTLKNVCAFMEEQRPHAPLWRLSLDDYLAWLNHERDRGRSDNVLAKQLSHVRGLLDYAWRSGRADRNVLDGFSLQDRVRQTPPRVLTLDEAARLVRACPAHSTSQRRSRVVVLLLYGCGLRTSELCALDVRDVDVETRQIAVRKGKGNRQRTIPVPTAVWTELLAYLAERSGKRGPLFRTQARGTRIAVSEVGQIVKAAVHAAGIEGKVTPRTLRHTFGTHLMDRGVDVAVIASLMGHRTPAETGVYLHVLPGRSQDAVSRLHHDDEEDDR
jgi:site-specific recombinase XerD